MTTPGKTSLPARKSLPRRRCRVDTATGKDEVRSLSRRRVRDEGLDLMTFPLRMLR